MSRIYKILTRALWQAAAAAGRFDGAAIDLTDGYIHFSTAAQAQETARLHFRGQTDLVVLGADAGSKARKAAELNVRTLSEEAFREMIGLG